MNNKKCFIVFILLNSVGLGKTETCVRSGHELIGDRCYVFVNQKLNFWSALEYCYTYTGTYATLATINNAIQSNFVASFGGSNFDSSNTRYWIGAYRDSSNDNFRWTDGSRFLYSNFDRGFPSGLNYVVGNTINGKWQTYDDSETFPFVCSYYAFGTTVAEASTVTEAAATTFDWDKITTSISLSTTGG